MKVLVFGGTTESGKLVERLIAKNAEVTLCVATEYGKSITEASYPDYERLGLRIVAKRLNQSEMADWLEIDGYDYVVDATHPYAEEVTRNIKAACVQQHVQYLRLLRAKAEHEDDVIYANSAVEAAEILKNLSGNVLMAIGSKELEPFTVINDYANRLYVRILPMAESFEKAVHLGFRNANIICMQGPFSVELNAAMLKMIDAKYMVTKDSGEIGGFSQKLEAAAQAGCKVIVISRPVDEQGYSFEEILGFFSDTKDGFTYFPLFINMSGKKINVIGGGKIAERRIKTLLEYGADITVVAPEVTSEIYEKVKCGAIKHKNRKYECSDAEAFLTIAATNDRTVNQTVMLDAKKLGCLVIVSDSREDCDCYFPAIAQSNEFIAGLVSKKGNHKGLKQKARQLRRWMNE